MKTMVKTCVAQYPKEFKKREQGWKKGEIASGLIGLFDAPGGGKFGFIDKTTNKVGDVETVESFGSGNQWTEESAILAINALSANWVCFINGDNLEAHNRDITKPSPAGDIIVSNETGLLAVSGIDVKNASVTTFLDDPESSLCNLILQSEKNAAANGKYLILKKRFHGHFEGPEWYTEYTCTNRVA